MNAQMKGSGLPHRAIGSLNAVLLVLLCLWTTGAQAAVPLIVLQNGAGEYPLGNSVRFLKDPQGRFKAGDVLAGRHNSKLFSVDSRYADFGFDPSVYWLVFRLVYSPDDQAQQSRHWWLMARYPLLDDVDVYLDPPNGVVRRVELGDQRPIANNALVYPAALMALKLKPGETYKVAIRVQTGSSKQLGFDVWSGNRLAEHMAHESLFRGVFYGIMLIMVLYNLFIFLSIRDRAYLYYVLGIASFLVSNSTMDGSFWVWFRLSDPAWYNQLLPISMGLTWVWLNQFTRSFLQTKKTAPFLDRIVFFFLIASIWMAGLTLFADYDLAINVTTRATLLFALGNSFVGILLWRRGYLTARYFTLAWVAFMLGVMSIFLYVFDLMPYNYFLGHGVQIGAFASVLLLALALADRINAQKRETERARRRALLAKRDADAANQRAQQNLRMYQHLYENASEGIFQCSLDGRFLSANPSLAATFGFESPATLMATVSDIAADCYVNPDERHEFEKRVLRDRRVTEFESQYRRADGSLFWGSSSAHLVLDGEGKPAYFEGSLVDITERKEKEKALREREAAQASATAKSEFLANMSHEIRTPMNAIIGFADLALRSDLTDKQRGYLTKIEHASNALLGIINDVLDFSKIEAGKLDLESVPFDLNHVVGDVVDMLSHRVAEKDLELTVTISRESATALVGDPLRLGQILINLTNNAIKFTTEGEILIRISELQTIDSRTCLQFRVKDTGIGIRRDQVAKLFSPFTQADGSTTRKYGGTGLGLTICRKLVEMMDGEIWAESQEGQGSEFIFNAWFEMQDEQARHNIYATRTLEDVRVLLIDDRDQGQDALLEILSSFNCRASFIEPDYKLVSQVEELLKEDNFDLVMVDRQLVAMGSIDAALSVRRLSAMAEVPILLMALSSEESLIEETRQCGFHSLIKPVTPSVVLESLQSVLGLSGTAGTRPARPGKSPPDLRALAGLKVLLVEDTPFNQEIAQEILKRVDVQVTIAANGEEGLEALRKACFDLVLMDVQMPVMDGFEATRRIRNQLGLKDLPVVAMTANAMKGDRKKCLDAGMNDYVSKPVDQQQLYRTLLAWTGRDNGGAEGEGVEGGRAEETDASPGKAPSEARPVAAPVLDLAGAREQLAGDENLLQKLLRRFREEQMTTIDRMVDAFDAGDSETTYRMAHSLRGVAASIGALRLAAVAAELERALERQTLPARIERLFCRTDLALSEVLDLLSQHDEEHA